MHRPGFNGGHHGRGADLDAKPVQLFLRAARQFLGIGGKNPRTTLDQQDLRAFRINRTELMEQRVTADFSQRSGEFYSGGSSSHHNEIEREAGFAGCGLAFG